MKNIFAYSLFTFAFSILAALSAKAEFLYFQANAFSWDGPKLFDYAMVGVAWYDGEEWVQDWGDNGSSMYLHLYADYNATIGSSTAASVSEVLSDFNAYSRGSDDDLYHAYGWADVSEYMDSDEYAFYVETYRGDDEDPIWGFSQEGVKTYDWLMKNNHIYISGKTAPQDVTAWVVPEPTSALLMLLGVAGLALKRRKLPLA